MQPIPPPPRYNARSRAKAISSSKADRSRERSGFLATLIDKSPVKNWVPFAEGDETESSSMEKNRRAGSFTNDIGISTSWSGESDDKEEIEIELGPPSMRANESINWDWTSEPVGGGDIEPVPLPSAHSMTSSVMPVESFASSSSIRTTSSATEPTSNLSNERRPGGRLDMRPTGIPPARNRNYVKRIGLSDRKGGNDDGSESADESTHSRGRQTNSRPKRRGRSSSRARASSRAPRQGRSRSVANGEKSKDSKPSRRARSIARLRSRANKAKNDEADSSFDARNDTETGRYSGARENDNNKPTRPPLHSPHIDEPPVADNSTILIESSVQNTSVVSNSTATSTGRVSVCLPRPIHTRNLLTTSVYHNQQTDIWITTINMSQKDTVTKSNAAKYLKAFSFQTEHEARESAYANAPAKMIPFDESPHCFVCDQKFAVFRRASHCRNCGVCICSSCSVTWSRVCIPDTYNIKNEYTVKVCKSCNSLSKKFRRALLEANYEEALTIYNTGNINLRCPFSVGKGDESSLPVHCAVEGGSLELLQWLVDVHFCPIKRIRTGNNRNKSQSTDELITTSKGRSVVEIAMCKTNVGILRYLVNEKSVSVAGIKDLNIALSALEAVLKQSQPLLPVSTPTAHAALMSDINTPERNRINVGLPSFAMGGADDECTDSEEDESLRNDSNFHDDDDGSVSTTVRDACIICYENSIDCVITPCGHQICCLQCSKNMKSCPVCNVNCKFIRIFRP